MLGIISIAILIISNFIIFWLFLVGANKNKTDEEKIKDDDEQMKYLDNYIKK